MCCLQESMVADILVFNPVTVIEDSIFRIGPIPSTGFKFRIVNGVKVVVDYNVLEIILGQSIRS